MRAVGLRRSRSRGRLASRRTAGPGVPCIWRISFNPEHRTRESARSLQLPVGRLKVCTIWQQRPLRLCSAPTGTHSYPVGDSRETARIVAGLWLAPSPHSRHRICRYAGAGANQSTRATTAAGRTDSARTQPGPRRRLPTDQAWLHQGRPRCARRPHEAIGGRWRHGWHDHPADSPWPGRGLQELRAADVRQADGARLALPHLFDVETDHRRRDDAAVRAGQVAARRSGREVRARAREPESVDVGQGRSKQSSAPTASRC